MNRCYWSFDMNAQKKSRVLIADDDPVFVEVATSKLSRAGFDVISVSNGAKAMQKLQTVSVDVAIVDIVMPQIDGLRLIALIRATPGIRGLPVLVITSETDPAVQAEGLQVGANDLMTKPVDWKELPGRIDALIEG